MPSRAGWPSAAAMNTWRNDGSASRACWPIIALSIGHLAPPEDLKALGGGDLGDARPWRSPRPGGRWGGRPSRRRRSRPAGARSPRPRGGSGRGPGSRIPAPSPTFGSALVAPRWSRLQSDARPSSTMRWLAPAVHVDHERHAAGVVLEAWVVEALGGRRRTHWAVHSRRSGGSGEWSRALRWDVIGPAQVEQLYRPPRLGSQTGSAGTLTGTCYPPVTSESSGGLHMAGSVILGGARTPIGKLSGALAGFSAAELGGLAIKAALERAGVSPDQVDYVFMGQVLQAGAGQIAARQAAVNAGIPMTVPATTINKVCLSGLNAIHLADQMIQARRGRHRRRRRHGVDDPGAVPPARRPRRLPHRRPEGRRLDDVRRPLLRLRPGRHGRRHREVRRVGRPRPRAAGRARRQVPRAGRPRRQGRPVRQRDRQGRDPAAQGRPGGLRHRRGRPRRHHRRVARRPAPRVRQGRQHHRRQRLADLRRRRRCHRRLQGRGRAARRHAARRGRRLRPGGRARPVAAHPAVAGHQGRRRAGRQGRVATSRCSSSTRPSPPSAWPR